MEKSYANPINDFLVCTYATETYRPTHEFFVEAVIPSGLEEKVSTDNGVSRSFVFITRPGEENYKKASEVYE